MPPEKSIHVEILQRGLSEKKVIPDAQKEHCFSGYCGTFTLQSSGSALDPLLQDIIEESFGGVVVRSPFRTERRSLLHLSQGGKKRAVQLSCTRSLHLGLDNELVARFPDGALRRQLLKSVLDCLRIRAVDTCHKLEFHLGRPFVPE